MTKEQLGHPNYEWQIEFTQTMENVIHQHNDDDILMFYPSSQNENNQILKNISSNNLHEVRPKNLYWLDKGIMIKDPEDYLVMISNERISHT